MKKLFIATMTAAAITVGFGGTAIAADKMQHMDHSGHMGHSMHSDSAYIDGTVKKVDKAAGKVTLSHGPLPNGMPAMTMTLPVTDKTWLDKVKAGDAVRYKADTVNGAMMVVDLQPGK